MELSKLMPIFRVHSLQKLVSLAANAPLTVWQIESEEGHSFGRPNPDAADEIGFPTSHSPKHHRRAVSFLAGAKSPFGQHSVGGFHSSDKYPAYARRSRGVWGRAVADGKAGIFPLVAMPLNSQQQVFGEDGAAVAGENGLM